jgi:formylglycine-generating enzyme required for sulfatase activity
MSLKDQVAELKKSLGVEMVLVPGGDFLYGDDKQTMFLEQNACD